MSVRKLLSDLKEQNISLYIEGESIRCRAPKGALTEELKESIKEYKDELILYISNEFEYEDNIRSGNNVAEIEYSRSLDQVSGESIDQNASSTSNVKGTNNKINDRPIIPPSTVIEKLLLDIWIDALKQERISITDSFFELGGDSVLAINVITTITDIFGVDFMLPFHTMFTEPTIRDLANTLLENEESPGKAESIAEIHQKAI
ncbi:MAG: phosphopantetheine-binding protein [Desulfobacteraceae bacterium]|jgi:acyl carrier protein